MICRSIHGVGRWWSIWEWSQRHLSTILVLFPEVAIALPLPFCTSHQSEVLCTGFQSRWSDMHLSLQHVTTYYVNVAVQMQLRHCMFTAHIHGVMTAGYESDLCQFSTNLEMVNCKLGPTFEAKFQHMWKMSWCEVTKFGLECHWRCFLEIAKSWNIDIPLERGNPYYSNGATYVWICGILREIWPFYRKLLEMESLHKGIPERTLDIIWDIIQVPYLSGNLTGSTFILKGSIFWKFCLSSM